MSRLASIRILAAATLLAAGSAAFGGKWEELKDCRLVTDQYRDGDSFHVRCGLKEYIFRLYFVDAPETMPELKDRIAEQSAYFGIPESRVIPYGRRAAEVTAGKLKNGFTVYTQWQDAEGSSEMQRFFAVVKIGKEDLAEILVSEGLARVYGAAVQLPDGTSVDTFFSRLRALETRAKSKRLGCWSKSDAVEAGGEEPAAAAATNQPAEPAGNLLTPEPKPSWPNVPTVAFLRAEAYINLERFEEAEPELTKLLQEYPDHNQRPRIEFYIALCATMQERFQEGIKRFEEWQRQHPNDPLRSEVEYWMPIAMYYGGEYEKALPLFTQYAAKYPRSVYTPESEYRAACCRYAMEDYKGCAMSLGAWLEKYPTHFFHWEALVTRADALAAAGMLDQAKDNYLRVTSEAGPFYYLALTQLAKVYKALGTEQDYRDMAAAFARYIRENPDSGNIVDAAYQAGWALKQAGRPDDARQLYWGIIERCGNSNTWEGFEFLLKDLHGLYAGQPDGAYDADFKAQHDKAVNAGRLTLVSRLDLSRLSTTSAPDQRLADAATFANRFKIDVLGPEGVAFVGQAFDEAGRRTAARPYFQRLITAFPDSSYTTLARTRLAEDSLETNGFASAYDNANLAASVAADPPLLMQALFVRACAQQGLQHYDEAVADFTTVLGSRSTPRPLKPKALLGIGACMEAQNRLKEAIPYYQRIYVMYQAYTDSVAKAYLKSGEAFEQLNDRPAAINTYHEMLGLQDLANTPEAAEARERLAKLET